MKQLIRDYKKLYRDYAAGRLTDDQYNARLQELRKKHNTEEIINLHCEYSGLPSPAAYTKD